jgi:hypothetical protein
VSVLWVFGWSGFSIHCDVASKTAVPPVLDILDQCGSSRPNSRFGRIHHVTGFGDGLARGLFAVLLVSGHFANYNATYGALGAVVGLMMWMWLSTIVVLVGAELNSEIEHQTSRDSTVGPEAARRTRRRHGRYGGGGENLTPDRGRRTIA